MRRALRKRRFFDFVPSYLKREFGVKATIFLGFGRLRRKIRQLMQKSRLLVAFRRWSPNTGHFEWKTVHENSVAKSRWPLKAGPPPPPLIWVFGHFWLFLHHGIANVERQLLWKIHKKDSKEKLVKCATKVARLHKVSIQSCTKRPSPKVQSRSGDWSARRFGAAGSSPDFSRGFSRHGAPRPLSWTFFQCTLLSYPSQPSYSHAFSLSQRSGQVVSGLRTQLVRITLTCSQSDRCFLRMSISTSSVVSRVDWKACA